jgi:hypothetical protein
MECDVCGGHDLPGFPANDARTRRNRPRSQFGTREVESNFARLKGSRASYVRMERALTVQRVEIQVADSLQGKNPDC